MDNTVQQFFTFSTFIQSLKTIERFKGHFYWKDYPQLQRYESVADHSWRLAVLVVLVSERLSQKIDLQKALTMAILHDIAEVIAGDAQPMGNDGTGKNTYFKKKHLAEEKYLHERQAAQRLFAKLPASEANRLLGLWLEYEKRESFESKVVKALDAIECGLQVLEYRQGHMFPKHVEFTEEYCLKHANVDPFIQSFARVVVDQIKEKYRSFPEH